MNTNDIFRIDDPHAYEIGKYAIHRDWWSRHYEYPWAMQFAGQRQIVADMGTGWWERPLKHALADICDLVVAVDAHEDVLKLKNSPKLLHVHGDFINGPISGLAPGNFDRVFCISVLEDLGNWLEIYRALSEFDRIMAVDGRMVITFDTIYEPSLPTPIYPGLGIEDFISAVEHADLEFVDRPIKINRERAVANLEFNLCVVHCVLKRPNEN